MQVYWLVRSGLLRNLHRRLDNVSLVVRVHNWKFSNSSGCGCQFHQHVSSTANYSTHSVDNSFHPKKVALLVKMTRYEYEQRYHDDCDDIELRRILSNKGSDYDGLLQRHIIHHETVRDMKKAFESKNIDVEIVGRQTYDQDVIKWADVIFSAGGDGTYLLAASKIDNKYTPVIGVNTDPVRSEGYLCLPKYYSRNFREALDKLYAGKFRWVSRQRIRITMSGKHENDQPVELHEEELQSPEHRFSEHVREHEETNQRSDKKTDKPPRVLPSKALNEVFLGESLSARVSYYEFSVDDSPKEKQKSSGVTVCTGTGSSSWFFNINLIPQTSIKDILRIANDTGRLTIPVEDTAFVRTLTEKFNDSLKFDASKLSMAYTIRDPVVNGIFQVSSSRGFAKKIVIKSRMWDARLVVDGGVSFGFNDGAMATLEMFEEDALKTVELYPNS